MDTVVGTALDMFVHHGLPWMGKKAVEMGRYYGSEALRDPKLQKKAIDYTLDKLNPIIQNVSSQALDSLPTQNTTKKYYKTNRKDLDGGALDIHKLTDQKQDGHQVITNTWDHIIHKTNNWNMIKVLTRLQKLAR